MTDQTPSGNRWEPIGQPGQPLSAAATAPVEPSAVEPPPPAPTVPERPGRWRDLLDRAELPDRPFDQDGDAPGSVPGTES